MGTPAEHRQRALDAIAKDNYWYKQKLKRARRYESRYPVWLRLIAEHIQDWFRPPDFNEYGQRPVDNCVHDWEVTGVYDDIDFRFRCKKCPLIMDPRI